MGDSFGRAEADGPTNAAGQFVFPQRMSQMSGRRVATLLDRLAGARWVRTVVRRFIPIPSGVDLKRTATAKFQDGECETQAVVRVDRIAKVADPKDGEVAKFNVELIRAQISQPPAQFVQGDRRQFPTERSPAEIPG